MHCLLSFVRLHEQGRAEAASASTLAWYAALAVKRGRPAGSRMNGKEPLVEVRTVRQRNPSRAAARQLDRPVGRRQTGLGTRSGRRENGVSAWFATLTQRMKQIAKELALGFSTTEVARKHGVTAGRISQLRRTLEESWAAFQQEAAPAVA